MKTIDKRKKPRNRLRVGYLRHAVTGKKIVPLFEILAENNPNAELLYVEKEILCELGLVKFIIDKGLSILFIDSRLKFENIGSVGYFCNCSVFIIPETAYDLPNAKEEFASCLELEKECGWLWNHSQ